MSSSLGPAGIVGGRSECTALSLHPQYHDWGEQGTEPPTAPRAPQHWLPTAPGVCSLLCVCTLDGSNAEHKFRVWVTILGRMSLHFPFHTSPSLFITQSLPAEGVNSLVLFHFTAWFNDVSFHMQTQSEGLNFYFEITMYNKSHIEICWCIILCWHRFINDLRYKWPLSNPNSQHMQRKSLAPFTHTVFTGKLQALNIAYC